MSKIKIISSFILVLLIVCFNTLIAQTSSNPEYLKNEIIIKTTVPLSQGNGVGKISGSTGIMRLDNAIEKVTGAFVKELFPHSQGYGVQKSVVLPSGEQRIVPDLNNIFKIQFDGEINISELLADLENDPSIIFAEPNYIARAAGTPNDPMLDDQWALEKIKAHQAWEIETGGGNIVIGILDTGIDLEHEDLKDNIWVNPGEQEGTGTDDDNNGYIDDVYGWNFVSNNNNPQDDAGHGTHVSGIVAAVTDNNTGVAGVAWNSKLMAVKVLNSSGQGAYSAIAQGIVYAAENGADVINMSLGGYFPSELLETALLNAYATSVLVASAGNESTSNEFYPAAYPYVIAVAATDSNEVRWSDSNYGTWVDIAAPGVDIMSTRLNYTYGTLDGTSMASALVSGAVALVRSKDITMDPPSVFTQIVSNTDNIDAQNEGYEDYLGSGRLNVYNSLTEDKMYKVAVSDITILDGQPYGDGDGDGILDAGETAGLMLTVYNEGITLTNLTVSLYTDDELIEIDDVTLQLDEIKARSYVELPEPFMVQVDDDVENDREVNFILSISSNETSDITSQFTLKTQREFTLGGMITSDLTLERDRSYVVENNILISEGVTLTIKPGVVIRFNEGRSIQALGTIVARGTEELPIIFTANNLNPTPGHWGQIALTEKSQSAVYDDQGNYVEGGIFKHVVIEYGGRSVTNVLHVKNSSPYIANSTIRLNDATGIYIEWGVVNVEKNNILNNNGFGVYSVYDLNRREFDATDTLEHKIDVTVFEGIKDNIITNNTKGGIRLHNAKANIIGNKISYNGYAGIEYQGYSIIAENDINGNSRFGIKILDGSPQVQNNNIITNGWDVINSEPYLYEGCEMYLGALRGSGNYFNNIIAYNAGYVLESSHDIGIFTNNLIFHNDSACELFLIGKMKLFSNNTIVYNTIHSTYRESSILKLDGWNVRQEEVPKIIGNNISNNKSEYYISNNVDGYFSINATGNWWDTTDESIIQEMMFDWFDDPNLSIIDYSDYLDHPSQSAPAYLHDIEFNPPSPVGIEEVEMKLTYSRAVDHSANPVITLRHSSGIQQQIEGESSWINEGQYTVLFSIDEMYHDGDYIIEVGGGLRNEGFKIPPDSSYKLLVYTAGAAARELIAIEHESKAELSWNPAGISNLLGYNVLRSTKPGGPYSKVNRSIITGTEYTDEIFRDGPGDYYYVYTIVDGTFRESGYSNEVKVNILTSVEKNREIPDNFVIYQNYPNPFNPTTTFRYGIPENSNIKLSIYNTIGQNISTLVNENQEAGYHEITFDASHLPSGVYIYRLQAGEYVESRKLLYLK